MLIWFLYVHALLFVLSIKRVKSNLRKASLRSFRVYSSTVDMIEAWNVSFFDAEFAHLTIVCTMYTVHFWVVAFLLALAQHPKAQQHNQYEFTSRFSNILYAGLFNGFCVCLFGKPYLSRYIPLAISFLFVDFVRLILNHFIFCSLFFLSQIYIILRRLRSDGLSFLIPSWAFLRYIRYICLALANATTIKHPQQITFCEQHFRSMEEV